MIYRFALAQVEILNLTIVNKILLSLLEGTTVPSRFTPKTGFPTPMSILTLLSVTLSITYMPFGGIGSNFQTILYPFLCRSSSSLANNAVTDEMSRSVAFHLGLHGLQA